jgi:hypothetical protein
VEESCVDIGDADGKKYRREETNDPSTEKSLHLYVVHARQSGF